MKSLTFLLLFFLFSSAAAGYNDRVSPRGENSFSSMENLPSDDHDYVIPDDSAFERGYLAGSQAARSACYCEASKVTGKVQQYEYSPKFLPHPMSSHAFLIGETFELHDNCQSFIGTAIECQRQ